MKFLANLSLSHLLFKVSMLSDFSIIIYNIFDPFSLSIIPEKDVQIQWILLNLGPINHILDFIFWIQSDTITNYNPIQSNPIKIRIQFNLIGLDLEHT